MSRINITERPEVSQVISEFNQRLQADPTKRTEPRKGALLAALRYLNQPLAYANKAWEDYTLKLEEFFELLEKNHLLPVTEVINLAKEKVQKLTELHEDFARAMRIGRHLESGQKIEISGPMPLNLSAIVVPKYKQDKVKATDLELVVNEYFKVRESFPNGIVADRIYFEECQRLVNKLPNLVNLVQKIENPKNLSFYSKHELKTTLDQMLVLFNRELPLRDKLADPLEAIAHKHNISVADADQFLKHIYLGTQCITSFVPENLFRYLMKTSPRDVYGLVTVEGLRDEIAPAHEVNGVSARLRICDWYGIAMRNEFPRQNALITSLRNINDSASNINQFLKSFLATTEEDFDLPDSNHPFGLGSWSEFRALVSVFRYKEGQSLNYYGIDSAYELMGFKTTNVKTDKVAKFFDDNKIDICLRVKNKETGEEGYIPLQIKYSKPTAKRFSQKYPMIHTLFVEDKSLDDLDKELEAVLAKPKLVIPVKDFQELTKIPLSSGEALERRQQLWKQHLRFECSA